MPVARSGQHRHRDGVLALFVPPIGLPPRVVRLGVHRFEERVRQATCHVNTTSPTDRSRSRTNGGSTAWLNRCGSSCVRNNSAARHLRSRPARLGEIRDARSHGTASSFGLAQCHIHSGYSINRSPVRSVAIAAAAPTASWSGCPSPRQVAAHQPPCALESSVVSTSANSHRWVLTSPSGRPREIGGGSPRTPVAPRSSVRRILANFL